MRKFVSLLLLVGSLAYGMAQPLAIDTSWFRTVRSAHHLTYWFDDNHGSTYDLPLSQTTTQIDVSFLPLGMHTIHCYAVDSSGGAYPTTSTMFFCPPSIGSVAMQSVVYWFDEEYDNRRTASLQHGPQLIDASGLAIGMHTIHSYVVGAGSKVYPTTSTMFFCAPATDSASGQSVVFWFDEDYDSRSVVSQQTGICLVDPAGLSDGMHTIHSYVVGADNRVYPTTSTMFFHLPSLVMDSVEGQGLVYWFDDDYENRVVSSSSLSGIQLIDASGLSIGMHTIHSYVVGGNGIAYPTTSTMFFRPTVADSASVQGLVYWFDEDYDHRRTASSQSGIQMIDASGLDIGMHTVHGYVVDANGVVYPTTSSMFFCPPAMDSSASVGLVYWFDEDYAHRQHSTLSSMGQGVDVSALSAGVHTLHSYMVGAGGMAYPTISSMFFSAPMGDMGASGITEYYYWVNDETENATRVRVSPVANPLQVYGLIPMPTIPFRSSSFHFEIDSMQVPHAYAKNTFNTLFYDVWGRLVLGDPQPFVDYHVSQAVVSDTILPFVAETFAKVTNNSIKWFRLTSRIGDSLAFKSNGPCTMQLFDPEGQEVYSATDNMSTAFGGTHAWHNGTYYLAVHDATYSGNANLVVEYQHYDKYAVLAQDVDRVGNGGLSAITFKGNGFDGIANVLAVHGTDTLPCHYHTDSNRTEMKVVWNFEDATIGQYSLAFCFVDDTIVLNNALTVETAREMIISTDVTYPSSFVRGSTVKYSVTITNTGNMTAFYVPVYVYIESESLGGISNVKINGLGLTSLAETIGLESLTSDEIELIDQLESDIGDGYRFMMYEGYDSISQRDKGVRSNYFMIPLAPNETKRIELSLTTTEPVEVYITAPDTISPVRMDDDGSYLRDYYCCIKDKISCVLNMAGYVEDVLSVFAPAFPEFGLALDAISCVTGTLSMLNSGFSYTLCNDDTIDRYNGFMEGSRVSRQIGSMLGTFISCCRRILQPIDFETLLHGQEFFRALGSGEFFAKTLGLPEIIRDWQECRIAFTQKSPGCPPKPPKGGRSNPRAPVDPNEIIGYLASSGSTYIPAGVQTVNYEIECENEVEFATSSAHTVTVVDTLSSALFDLSTFKPTQAKIGQHTLTLDGTQNQVATIDLRPEVSAIAEVSVTLDTATGVARWVVATLDPITFAPITDPAIGVLPPNTDGSGVASFAYRIDLRNPVDGAVIPNRAYITFDNEAPIATPVWVNTIDAVAPTSRIAYAATAADSITMSFAGSDNRSGLWRYELYGRQDSLDSWRVVAPNISHSVFAAPVDSTVAEYYVVAIDSAGNRESKTPQVEYSHAGGVVGPSVTTYQIRFANYDNALLQTYHMPLGAMPAYLGGVPTRLADSHYSYRFSGWNPSLQPVTGNTVYHAVYDSIPNRYCVRFYDYDSTLLYWDSIEYGYTPTYQGVTPTHAAVDTFVYAFAGWSPALRPITGDADYRPVFDSMPYGRVPLYAVAFVNWNDTILQSDSVPFGSTPHYWGTEPTRTADARCNYRFAGWSPSLLPTRGNVTYRAMFDTIVQHYPITFVNFNGAVLQQEMVAYGEMPVYHGNVPTRRSSFLYSYSFAGWSPNLVTVSNEAVYTATFDSALRCTTQYQYEDITTCEPITWRDRLYTATGTYSQQVENVANGCDSIYVLNLTVNSSSSSSVAQVVCDSYLWHGHTYTASTVVKDTLTNSVGCDSVITLNLTVNHSSTGVQYATACDSYTWNGITYTTSTSTPTMIEQNATGCDSVITLNLTVNYSSTGVQYATACDSYTWNGSTYTTSTSTPTMTEQNVAGCDSVITLNLTVNYSSEGTDILSACDSLTWIDGITYTISTQDPRFTLVNEDGCDSVISLDLTVNYSSETEETFTISDGDLPYSFGGQLFEDYGYYDVLLQSEAGCDSVIHLYLNRSSENGIDNSDVHSINIYPNPTNGWVYIHSDEVVNVIVMDMLGRKVAQCESNQIDLSKNPSGNYYLFITTHNGLAVKRIVKR